MQRGSIKEILENSLQLNKYNIAVYDGDNVLNYEQLSKYSYRIAAYLKSHNIGTEDVVGIYMERSYLSICTTIGICRAGAAFLPIDKKNPMSRVEIMLNKSNAKSVFFNSAEKDIVYNNETWIDISQIINDTSLDQITLKDIAVSDSDLAYVIFTSGSTGMPKGVMIEFAGMCNHLKGKIKALKLSEKSVVAHNASISFDISVWQVFAPLCMGGSIAVFSEATIINIRKFIKNLEFYKVSVLEVVPTYLILMINQCKKHKLELDSLEYILSTGQELTGSLVNMWFELFPNIPLVNAYGPTEASDDITHCIISSAQQYEKIPIGTPITNADFTIIDDNGDICNTGEVGELLVSGLCVGRGYINDEEETRKHFLIDSKTGVRIYKTGDLVSLLPDMNYLYHGRKDSQIKLHGNRIELKEIENCLQKYYAIEDVAVVFQKEKEQIYAIYSTAESIDLDLIREYIKTELPVYMRPSKYIKVNRIPVNVNGKTDYKKVLEMMDS